MSKIYLPLTIPWGYPSKKASLAFLSFFLLLFSTGKSIAQTTLTAGDIAVVGYNTSGAPDNFAILVLKDLSAGTVFYVNDNEVSAAGGTAFTDLAEGEASFTVKSGQSIPAGTVIVLPWGGAAVSATTYDYSATSSFGLGNNNEEIYVYTASAISATTPTAFIYFAKIGTSASSVPAGLTTGTTAISPAGTALRYATTGAVYSGTVSALLSAIGNTAANWVTTGATSITSADWSFIVSPASVPSVNLSVSTNTASESPATVVTVTATVSSAVSGNQTVTVGASGTGITAGDYTLSDATITIPGGATSGSVTFTIVDDADVEGTETATLTISNPSAGITLGSTLTQNISITDNDIATPHTLAFVRTDTTVVEGVGIARVWLRVTAAGNSGGTVDLALSNYSTATNNTDYTVVTTLNVPANLVLNQLISFDFTISDDASSEADEYVICKLINASNVTVSSTAQSTLYIKDNDTPTPVATNQLGINFVTSFSNGASGSNSAEISAYDAGSKRLFIANSIANKLDIVNLANPSAPVLIASISLGVAPFSAAINSVDVRNGVVALALEGLTDKQANGKIVFVDTNGVFISEVATGAMPDMITFNHAGTKVYTANEGEPNAAYTNDPVGSITVVDISGGVGSPTVATIGFTAYNGQEAALRSQGIRIFGLNATAAQDFEPEYITISDDDTKAWVTLQENNALAELDLTNNSIVKLIPLGYKDHSLTNNSLDASDQTFGINLSNFPFKGMYMPDAIASYTSGGNVFLITANEGDARGYSGFNEESRVGALNLDPTVFPNASELKDNRVLGRLNATNKTGDIDNDGDIDEIYVYGSRSFSIWNPATSSQVYDSKNELERITANDPAFGQFFNMSNTVAASTIKNRSDDKGPEPEGVTIAKIGGKDYAFVALERIGGVIAYDVTNPASPAYVGYANNRTATTGDRGSEGIIYIPASESPNGKNLVILSNEVSSTISVYEIAPCLAPGIADIANTGSTSIYSGDSVKLYNVNSNASYIYQWLKNDSIIANATDSVYFAKQSGDYKLVAFNSNGCVDTSDAITLAVENTYTLQILHASDFEASVDAVNDAPRFAAIVDTLEHTYPNSITLSSGDNFIPSPFSYSGEDPRLVPAYRNTYSSYYNTNVSIAPYDLRAGIGRADISILNFIGIEASVLGNHDFDFGTSELRNIIGGNISGSNVRWFGAQFPYLSSNLNFTGDVNLAPVFTANRLLNTAFTSSPAKTPAQIVATPKLAPSCIIVKNGEKIGIVGVTTPILAAISSPGATTVKGPGAGTENMTLLATIVQPYIDSMINVEGCNKIILLSHLQQIAFEKELATKLNGVDIIIGGGSNTLFADATDRLRAGDVAEETYPFFTTGLDANPIAIVNTDGNYKYVGRLVIDFDPSGKIIPSSVDPAVSGAYAADDQGVNDAWGTNAALAFAAGTRGKRVKELCDSIGSAIQAKDGNLFGKTSVFLEGRRNFVRTEETNLGNVSAEANLWMAKFYDPATTVSIKNGGGIRSLIGNVEAVGSVVTLSPPLANPSVGKQLGDISQLDIENSLRFNNQLSLVTVSAQGLRRLLEHGVAATAAGATPGQFPQIAGVRFSYNPALPVFSTSVPGSGRLLNAAITNEDGTLILDTLVLNGVTYGDTSRTIRVVTLNFLAGGGDSYPFPAVSRGRVDINTVPVPSGVPGVASFTNAGSEQDAFAEFMKSLYTVNPYAKAETPITRDFRIQNVAQRSDSVFNQKPLVSITSPTSPATYGAGSTIEAQVAASDIDGTVTKVELLVNGALYGIDSIAPYSFNGMKVEAGIYKVTAKAIDNLGAFTITDTLVITVTECNGSGTITGDGYTNIPGSQVADLTSSPDYPNNPSIISATLNSFEYVNVADNYGGRVRGYICAPVTGNYTFYISGDDQAGLWLSTNDNPADKVLIAYTESATFFRQYYKNATQKSVAIHLVKGGRYYIETLHKEATNGDHVSVAWVLPGGVLEAPISGSRLSPYVVPMGGRPAQEFTVAMRSMQQSIDAAKKLTVTAIPNPSSSYFTVTIKSNSSKTVSVKVMDAAGRMMESKQNIAANGTMQIGSKLTAGVYFVEVVQGTQREILKLVKQ